MNRTLLILGAGASKPYGFPTGSELLGDIKKSLSKENEFYYFLTEQDSGFFPVDMKNLLDSLNKTQPASIDEYMETQVAKKNKKLTDLAKCSIAFNLLKNEANERSLNRNGWYALLYNRIFQPSGSLRDDSNIAIITFNYDRSLENNLHKIYANRNGIDEDKIVKLDSLWNEIPIIHIHGSIGSEEYGIGENYKNRHVIVRASQGIIVGNDISSSQTIPEEIKTARRYIRDAKAIYILGFGYHENNIGKLDFSNNVKNKIPIIGTIMGDILENRRNRIKDKIPGIDFKNLGTHPDEMMLTLLKDEWYV